MNYTSAFGCKVVKAQCVMLPKDLAVNGMFLPAGSCGLAYSTAQTASPGLA